MKTLLSLFASSLIIIACSKKTVAAKDVTTNTSSETASVENFKTNPEITDASVLAVGKVIYETKCTRCHGLKPTIAYTTDRWNEILKLMAPKANLTEYETEQVTAYVRANAKK